jgi:hypothetical protein
MNNRFSYLESLTFDFKSDNSKNINERMLSKFINFEIFKKFHDSRSVYLNATFLSDFHLVSILNHCLNLKILKLDSCTNITDLSLSEISKKCLNLKIFNVDSCTKITDIGLISIVQNFVNLENFSLVNNENITDLSLIEISMNCLNLKIFKLESCF